MCSSNFVSVCCWCWYLCDVLNEVVYDWLRSATMTDIIVIHWLCYATANYCVGLTDSCVHVGD